MRVAHIPVDHPYVGAVDPDAVVRDNPWSTDVLSAVADAVHVHFGFEHLTVDELTRWVDDVRRRGLHLVHTVHDIDNPHLVDQSAHHARAGVLVAQADAVITLTELAACAIESRWRIAPVVIPHPPLSLSEVSAVPPSRHLQRHGLLWLGTLRPNIDVGLVRRIVESWTSDLDVVVRTEGWANAECPTPSRSLPCACSGCDSSRHHRAPHRRTPRVLGRHGWGAHSSVRLGDAFRPGRAGHRSRRPHGYDSDRLPRRARRHRCRIGRSRRSRPICDERSEFSGSPASMFTVSGTHLTRTVVHDSRPTRMSTVTPRRSHDIAVVTVVRGRRGHLARQRRWLGENAPGIRHVVMNLGGERIQQDRQTVVFDVAGSEDGPLPLSMARNLGAQQADADVVIFLDVDCLPTADLVATYSRRVHRFGGVWSGPVGYLPPAADISTWHGSELQRLSTFHAGRPRPGQRPCRAPSADLFWSLSFAVSMSTFEGVGGFDESFVGYGGEDTDFARRVEAAGETLWFDGDALAFHQHHPVSSPPIEHLREIVANAVRFHRRWSDWPMVGWLQAFADDGLIEWAPSADDIVMCAPGIVAEVHDVS